MLLRFTCLCTVIALVLCGRASAFAGSHDPVQLSGARSFSLSTTPRDIVVADVNKDGVDDLVVRMTDGAVAVLLSLGDGNFKRADTLRVNRGDSCSLPVVADFNGDGSPDIVLAVRDDRNKPQGQLVLFRGRGNGSFDDAKMVAELAQCPIGTQAVSGGDLDPNDWGATTNAPSAPACQESLFAADFNGDGSTDLLLIFRDVHPLKRDATEFAVLLGEGDGSFGKLVRSPQPFRIQGVAPVAVGDIDGNKWPDIAFGEDATQPQRVFLNNGDATFTVATSGRPDAGGKVPELLSEGKAGPIATGKPSPDFAPIYTIAIADFNKDGKQDLVLGGQLDGWTLLGRGDGTYAERPYRFEMFGVNALMAPDLDRDGKADVVASAVPVASRSPYSSAVQIFRGKGDGTLEAAWKFDLAGVQRYATGGPHGRGVPPTIVPGRGTGLGPGALLHGFNAGAFSKGVYYLEYTYYLPQPAAVGDFNGDGHPDLASLSQQDPPQKASISVYLNFTAVPFYRRVPVALYVTAAVVIVVLGGVIGLCLWLQRPGTSVGLRGGSGKGRVSFPPPVRPPQDSHV